jgi:hypothetical protein
VYPTVEWISESECVLSNIYDSLIGKQANNCKLKDEGTMVFIENYTKQHRK